MTEIPPFSATQAGTDDLIRSLVVEQKRDRKRAALPELAPPAEPQPERHRRTRAKKQPQRTGPAARLRKLRPRHAVWVALAVIMVVRPLLLPLLVLVSILVAVIVFLTLGPDRIAELLSEGWQRLARRRPALAERLRQRADRFALRFDAMLAYLPERWAEAMALPDLSRATLSRDATEERPDPFDRLRPSPDVYRG